MNALERKVCLGNAGLVAFCVATTTTTFLHLNFPRSRRQDLPLRCLQNQLGEGGRPLAQVPSKSVPEGGTGPIYGAATIQTGGKTPRGARDEQ